MTASTRLVAQALKVPGTVLTLPSSIPAGSNSASWSASVLVYLRRSGLNPADMPFLDSLAVERAVGKAVEREDVAPRLFKERLEARHHPRPPGRPRLTPRAGDQPRADGPVITSLDARQMRPEALKGVAPRLRRVNVGAVGGGRDRGSRRVSSGCLAGLEPRDPLGHQCIVDLMDLNTDAAGFQKRDGEIAAEMLPELRKADHDGKASIRIPLA